MLGLNHDASQDAFYWPDIAAEIDGDGDSERMRIQVEAEIEKRARIQAAAICSHVVCTILGYSNVRLALMAYAISHGIGGLGEKSIAEWAEKLGVRKQALSKEVTWFRDVYSIQAIGALKTNKARKHYQEAQNERYKRKQNGNGKYFNFGS